ncbi:MAG TPA: FKBP-type peptidyl-prolyl cis-trans isomerase N-terminal domain-containing protein [Chlamydiales bacterium]|nr:FKBP-type peptidyl-prolyl cis-trans isomerase N-terminal domain-containing protein [Chlamydiales bacterium]
MHKTVICICFAAMAFSQEPDVAKISEAMGHIIGKNLEQLGIDFDLEAIVKGLKEESEGKNSPLNDDECVQAIANLQEEKITTTVESDLERVDSLSNGDQIQDDENHSLPAPDSAKYR